jgi:hypothetical protein
MTENAQTRKERWANTIFMETHLFDRQGNYNRKLPGVKKWCQKINKETGVGIDMAGSG